MISSMNPAWRLRLRTDLDDRAVEELFTAANDGSGGRFAPSVTAGDDSMRSWLARKRLDEAWVLEQEGVVIGHVGLRRDLSAALGWGLPSLPWVEVCRLAVAPTSQRQGCAAVLLDTALRRCGTEPVWLTTHAGSPVAVMAQRAGLQVSDLPIRWSDDPTPGVLLTSRL